MQLELNEIEARVLGALIEKEITTPDYYPLSLNALTAACNQKSNRHPIMSLDQATVAEALRGLREKQLAYTTSGSDHRVPKYAHRLGDVLNLGRPETAVFCVLLLRGAQTLGEIRARAERMYHFDDLAAVESTLRQLAQREPPLVKQLARPAGTKEPRYAHLLAGDLESGVTELKGETAAPIRHANEERLARLEELLEELRQEIAAVRLELKEFRKQFE